MPSKLMSCSDCGKEVSQSASKCPNCGKPFSSDPTAVILAIAFFIFCMWVLGSHF